MKPSVSIVGLFCEDIRSEKSGSETIVGVFPSNVQVPGVPIVFPKFGLYARINLDPASPEVPIEIRIEGAGMEEAIRNIVDPSLLSKAKADARKQGAPLACIISRMLVASFQVGDTGRIKAIARIDDVEFVCAILNVATEFDQSVTKTAAL